MNSWPTLRPSLLERLTSAKGVDLGAAQEHGGSSLAELRQSVRRELTALFNATALSATQNLDLCPHVQRSVLNYGLPDLSGKTASSIDRPWLERQLARAIRDFEPRLRPQSLRVSVGANGEARHNTLTFEIDAEIEHRFGTERLAFQTHFDLESGTARVTELNSMA